MSKFRTVTLPFTHRFDQSTPWEGQTGRIVSDLPVGPQNFWGIPFEFNEQSLLIIGDGGSVSSVAIEVDALASFVVVAHFCDSRARRTVAGQSADYAGPVVTAPGEHLADYSIAYENGEQHDVPMRRRFEINQLGLFLQNAFVARQHPQPVPVEFRGPYPPDVWGRSQTGVVLDAISPRFGAEHWLGGDMPAASWSIYALPNPIPDLSIKWLRITPTGAAAIGVGAVTLFTGRSHPLRHLQLETVRVESRTGSLSGNEAHLATIDLGVISRRSPAASFSSDEWLAHPAPGWGEEGAESADAAVDLDVSGAADATLSVAGLNVELGDLYDTGHAGNDDVVLRVLTPDRTWLHGRIIDATTGLPTPARLHFRAADGRYFPPYGHRREVNDNWFEDYGADLKLGSTEYAYVDGTFQGELPVGEVYVEVVKGFEFQPVRARLEIVPGQRRLDIQLDRLVDSRRDGWVTADTHVHFLSPETARLEAQAEGLNLVNLLAAQWGDLYTNVGDLTGASSGSSHDDTIVWVGTENRQHFLGHLSSLGVKGEPVFPMSSAGGMEDRIGGVADWALSEWAELCRSREGLVVIPHFPVPHAEAVAAMVNGLVDGIELRDWHTPTMDTFAIHEWYRLLNCGFRVAAVGGTDKMSAGMPVGGVRTYANIGDDEFSFDAWASAVRAGRTYTTSGPLLTFSVEDQNPGGEIAMPAGGGTVHVAASALSTSPLDTLEVVYNGMAVAQARASGEKRTLRLEAKVEVSKSGWLAARCIGGHKAWHVWPINVGAHTSPVYVTLGEARPFDPGVGEYLITTMEGSLAWLDTLATRADDGRHAAIRAAIDGAIEAMQDRSRRHGG